MADREEHDTGAATDADLVRRCQAGDPQAFSILPEPVIARALSKMAEGVVQSRRRPLLQERLGDRVVEANIREACRMRLFSAMRFAEA